MRLSTTVAAIAVAMALAGCATPARRIKAHPQVYARATLQQQALISKGRIAIGFTPDFVRLAIGKPDRVTQRTTAAGTDTVWHYLDERSDVTYVGGFGFPLSPFFGPFFQPGILIAPAAAGDRLRVTFRNGRVTAINRVVHE
ncbi:MAG TPA: hypothetical protein VFQ88_09180 [Nevskiaceae bacterium]|nr:hypothetical protein [Nevskiaceae bacterium]